MAAGKKPTAVVPLEKQVDQLRADNAALRARVETLERQKKTKPEREEEKPAPKSDDAPREAAERFDLY